MFKPDSKVLVEALDATRWRLAETLVYEGDRDTFVVPEGYVTDFATVPRVAVWLIPRFGSYTKAAILHDWLITDALPAGRVTAREVDGLFRRVLRELGVPPLRYWLMWAGVRYGALFGGRADGWLRDAPRVLAISLGFLASIVPPAAMILVAAALAVYAVVDFAITLPMRRKTSAGSLST